MTEKQSFLWTIGVFATSFFILFEGVFERPFFMGIIF